MRADLPPADHDDIIYPGTIPFVLAHLACLGAIWTGVPASAVAIAVALYVIRMFAATAGYHRYFSHRSYRTSRAGQFLLALLAQSAAQRGVLWWAAKHRHHHRHSDTEYDVHSPRQRGFWYAHLGWIFRPQHHDTDLEAVADLARYPELRWLDRHQYTPAVALAVAVWLVAGWPGLIVGFFWSTVALYHGVFMINSLAHVHGTRRYVTGDDSRNNFWLALITMGEGWHNNHHAYQRSTRQGFRWWEVDLTFYILTVLSWLRIVWDLGTPPPDLVRNERPLGRGTIEKVAQQVAATFSAEQMARDIRTTLVHLPHFPSLDELRARAEAMYAQTPSMDEIVARAREVLTERVSLCLLRMDDLAPA